MATRETSQSKQTIKNGVKMEIRESGINDIMKNTLKMCKLSAKSGSISTENLLSNENESIPQNNCDENSAYILEKFFRSSQENAVVKPPIPKPRRFKRVESNDSSSQKTFVVAESPKHSSVHSNGTYNVNENLVGDVLLHEDRAGSKIVVVSTTSSPEHIEKADIERLTDTSVSSRSCRTPDRPKNRKLQEEIELEEIKSSPKTELKTEDEITAENRQIEELKPESPSYENVVEIIVHKTDKLQLNSFVTHPVVKVHIVDASTGKYLNKSDKNRNVVFYYENNETDYILPVMTHSYNLQEQRSLIPKWEERILINEDHLHVFKANVLVFFEIMDFPSSSLANDQFLHRNYHKGWHKIAFAFVKLVGKEGAENFNKKLRLQLNYLNPTSRISDNQCDVWKYWKTNKFKKYPSSIYVTVKSVLSPEKVVDAFRSKMPLQNEIGANISLPFGEKAIVSTEEELLKINRRLKKGSTITLPEECFQRIDCPENGCFLMKFSNNGNYLACSVQVDNIFLIIVHCVMRDEFKEVRRFLCHNGMIYGISWSSDDSLIVTASADNTVSIWDFNENKFLQILPHPKFVYSCDINKSNEIATGCYDGVIRIWCRDEEVYNLDQELDLHKGFVTSVCFAKKVPFLYTADSVGCVNVWQKNDDNWGIFKELKLIDLKNVIINQLLLFKNEKRLLIHSRDSIIRIVSLKNFYVLHCLQGAFNRRMQLFCSISPCGTYVVSGDESGLGLVWNVKTSEKVKTYNFYPEEMSSVIHCVQFHPTCSLFAVSQYGNNLPILIYKCSDDEEMKKNIIKKSERKLPKVTNEKRMLLSDIIGKIDEVLKS